MKRGKVIREEETEKDEERRGIVFKRRMKEYKKQEEGVKQEIPTPKKERRDQFRSSI